MSKAIEMAKTSTRGGFHLFLGVSLSSVIAALGTILLVRLLTPDQYGLYAIALIPPGFISLFRDWGMNSAIIKHLAQYRSENKTTEIRQVLASGLLFESVLGTLLSVICFLLMSFLAVEVFHRPELQPLIGIASITILAGALLTATQSTFTGFEKMELSSLTMIFQSGFKSFLAPLFVFLGYGTLGAVLGHTMAFLITSVIGIMLVYVFLDKNLHRVDNQNVKLVATFKIMFRYGLPLSVSVILSGFLAQFYNFMVAIYCTDFMIGNYQAAINFVVPITFLATPIVTVLFPAFSKLSPQREMETLRSVFQYSVKYASLLTIPATTAVIVLSRPLVFTLFGEKYVNAPTFLSLYAISYLYTALGNLSLANFLNGQGKTMVTMRLTMITLAAGGPIGLLLIPRFGIPGSIVATLFSGLPSLIIGLWWIKRHFGVTVDWKSSLKILVASAIAAVITQLVLSQLHTSEWMGLVVGGTSFLLAALIAVPLVRAIDIDDLRNLRQMLGEQGLLSRFSSFPLNLIEKLVIISQKIGERVRAN